MFWWATLLGSTVFASASAAWAAATAMHLMASLGDSSAAGYFLGLAGLFVGGWAGSVATIRRLHDLGYAGVWALLPASVLAVPHPWAQGAGLAVIVVIFGCLPGQAEANRYGEPAK